MVFPQEAGDATRVMPPLTSPEGSARLSATGPDHSSGIPETLLADRNADWTRRLIVPKQRPRIKQLVRLLFGGWKPLRLLSGRQCSHLHGALIALQREVSPTGKAKVNTSAIELGITLPLI